MYSKSLTILITLLSFFQVIAQSAKYETFYLNKFRTPIIEILEESNPTICFIAKNKHKTDEATNFYGLTSNNDAANYYNKKFNYKSMKVSLSYPNYTSEIHFNPDNQIIAVHKKTQHPELGQLNSFKYTTNLSAVQYITDLKSKKTHTRNIVLKKDETIDEKVFYTIHKQNINKTIVNRHKSYNSAISLPNVNALNLKNYLKNGKAVVRKEYATKVYNEQAKRILSNGESFIKKAFFKQPYKEKLSFFYIKKFKNFDIKPFNKAFEDVKTYFNSKTKDSTLIIQAASSWKKEIEKLNTDHKKEKRLYLQGIQNIVKVYYVLKNQDSIKKYVLKGRAYSTESDYLEMYLPNLKTNSKANSGITKLESIPETLFATNKFVNKSIDRINHISSFKSKDIQWIFNMYLVKDLAKEKSSSEYIKKQIFIALNKIYVERFLKKNYPNSAAAFDEYKKQVKKLFTKPGGRDEFFNKVSIEDINNRITTESLNAYFDNNFIKINPEYKNFIRSITILNSAIHILRNHNLKTEQYILALEDVKNRIGIYYTSLEEPKPEIVEEVVNNLKLIELPNKVIDLSKKEVDDLCGNLLKLASKLYPY